VLLRLCRIGACLALTGALAACDSTDQWFAKPLLKGNSGYTYSQLDQVKLDHPITANDLVNASGACPAYVPPASPQTATLPPDQAALVGTGVALGMSECDVVARLGQPTAVNLGQYPNGLRSAVLTYDGGPRPGVYRFESGRLSEMDRVEAPPPPPDKKVAKKKQPKPAGTSAPAANAGDKS